MRCARRAMTSARPTASRRTSSGQQRARLTQRLLQQVCTAVCMHHHPCTPSLILPSLYESWISRSSLRTGMPASWLSPICSRGKVPQGFAWIH